MPFRSLQVSVTRSIFALFLLLTPGSVFAGSMMLMGVGSAGGAAPPPYNVTITTTKPNDVVIVLVSQGFAGTTTATLTSPHLTFTKRATVNRFGNQFLDEYYAVATSPLTSEVITATMTGTPSSNFYIILDAFAVNGANVSSPFDPNGSLPGLVGTSTGNVGTWPIGSTTNSNTLIFGAMFFDATGSPTIGSGWTALGSTFNYLSEYKIVSSPQTGLQATSGNAPSTDVDTGILDAISQ
jgi:hypothetical protein